MSLDESQFFMSWTFSNTLCSTPFEGLLRTLRDREELPRTAPAVFVPASGLENNSSERSCRFLLKTDLSDMDGLLFSASEVNLVELEG